MSSGESGDLSGRNKPTADYRRAMGRAALLLSLVCLPLNTGCESRTGGGTAGQGDSREAGQQDGESARRKAFYENIDQHYQAVQSLMDNNDLEGAMKEVDLFRVHERMDYKEISSLSMKVEMDYYLMKLKELPVEMYEENLDFYEKLAAMDKENKKYRDRVAYYREKLNKEKIQVEEAQLVVTEWSCAKKEYGDFVKAEGSVRNSGDAELKRVLATLTLLDEKGKAVGEESAVIAQAQLPPGQTSAFSITAPYRPSMVKARLGFGLLMGEKLTAYSRVSAAPIRIPPAE